ncbi:Retinoblastoma-related protein, partial [Tetrabaena socialis]
MNASPVFDRSLASLLKGLRTEDAVDAHVGVLELYTELKENFEQHERASPVEYAGEQDEDVKHACKQASLLFVARVLFAAKTSKSQTQPSNMGIPISRIVAASGINLLDFFREANVVVSKLSAYLEARGSSSKVFSQQAMLKEHSETVVVMGLLAKKYKDQFNLFLHQLDFYKQVVLRLGWNAFLVLKAKLLSAFPDVVSCVELLPCIFAILVSHAPRLPDSLMHITQASRGTSLLKAMSETCKADYGRVQARMSTVEPLLTQILTTAVPEWRCTAANTGDRQTGLITAAACTIETGLDLIANPMLDGLVTDNDRMNRAVAALEREYEQHYSGGGHELDERDFLYTDFTKFASPRFSPGQTHSAMSMLGAGPMPLRPGGLLGPGAHTTAPLHAPVIHQLPMYVKMGVPPGMHSPLPMMHLGAAAGLPGTPVSEAMGASAWIRGITSSLGAEALATLMMVTCALPQPSAVLQRFLAAIKVPSTTGQAAGLPPVPPVQQLSRRVRDMVAAVIPDDNAPSVLGPFPLLQPSLAAERRLEAVKLFYHSLETILVVEEKATGLTGVAALLSSAKFHRGLVACCVEVVAACYRMVSCAFPKVLDALHIKAFDLAKMIQSFVKSVVTLPRELKRHLFLIEEKILESLAWEPGSSLYHVICSVHSETEEAVAADRQAAAQTAWHASPGGDLHQGKLGSKLVGQASSAGTAGCSIDGEQQHVSSTGAVAIELPVAGPPPSPKRTQGSAFSAMMSPSKKARGMDGTAYSTLPYMEHLPLSVGPPPSGGLAAGGAAGALFDFCRKVLKLAAFRLALMCEHFDFSPLDHAEVSSRVYEAIEHALYRQTHLFYNRHIDQVILSALYGYCKVHKLQQVSFREIIAQYRKQPQSQQSIFRSVVIEQSMPGLQITTRADIIAFYNQVFVPSMKSFLLQGESSASGASGLMLGGADSKSAAAGSSGNDTGAAVGFAATGGSAVSRMASGLPPLPPRHSSHSPRGPKLPLPTSAVNPFPRRTSGPSASLNPQAGTDSTGISPLRRNRDGDPNNTVAATHSPLKDDSSSAHPSSGPAPVAMPAAAGGHTRSLSAPRTRVAATADHKIPDGLAALLQALDSQQSADNEEEEAGKT